MVSFQSRKGRRQRDGSLDEPYFYGEVYRREFIEILGENHNSIPQGFA